MDDQSFIEGLMRENYEAVGFLTHQAVAEYIADGDYIIQHDLRGRRVGYLLHGKATAGGILTVAQHVIDVDRRNLGFGEEAFKELLARAESAGCKQLKVRCASTLPSVGFWQAMGLETTNILHPDNRRKRSINVMLLDIWTPLVKVPPLEESELKVR